MAGVSVAEHVCHFVCRTVAHREEDGSYRVGGDMSKLMRSLEICENEGRELTR